MVALSSQVLATLTDLIEEKLFSLSSAGREACAEYLDLQKCRHQLLMLAAEVGTAMEPPRRRQAAHLVAIPGGKG